MVSQAVVGSSKARKVPDGVWESWKPLIRRRFLYENESMDKLAKELGVT